jgi:hypothetical protein
LSFGHAHSFEQRTSSQLRLAHHQEHEELKVESMQQNIEAKAEGIGDEVSVGALRELEGTVEAVGEIAGAGIEQEKKIRGGDIGV